MRWILSIFHIKNLYVGAQIIVFCSNQLRTLVAMATYRILKNVGSKKGGYSKRRVLKFVWVLKEFVKSNCVGTKKL